MLGANPDRLFALQVARGVEEMPEFRPTEAQQILQQGKDKMNASEYQAAAELLQQALTLYRETGDRTGEAESLSNLGWAYYYLGQYQKGIEFHNSALTVEREIGDRNREAYSIYARGWAYFSLGQYPEAIEVYQKALAIFQDLKDKTGEAFCLGGIGWSYYYRGENIQAIAFHSAALAIRKQLEYRPGEAFSLGGLGVAYAALGLHDRAVDFHQQQLAIAREIRNRREEAYALADIGMAYSALKKYQQAINFFQQSLTIQREIGDRWGEKITLTNMGETLLNWGKKSEATEKLMEAIEILESLKPGLSDSSKISLLDSHARTYRLLQEVLIERDRFQAALEIAERSRARAFVELLALRLSDSDSEEFHPPQHLTVDAIEHIAKDQNATLIEYSLGKNKIFIWAIQPSGKIDFRSVNLDTFDVTLEEIASQTRIAAATGRSRGGNSPDSLIFNPGEETGGDEVKLIEPRENAVNIPQRTKNHHLQQSYQLLIEPIAAFLPNDPDARVIFIPQGPLFLVPFPALQNPQGTYLIEQHTILTAPSIQVLDLTHQIAQRIAQEKMPNEVSNSSSLVVGNPTMPSLPLALGEESQPLAPLPGAEQEAIAIARRLNTQPIVGDRATESAIVQQMASARIIHLATHGLLDELKHLGLGVPGALALTPSGNHDGLLTASEILSMKLNASLVVLSACNTGRGKITGDGVIGLSRSFISAGVSSVLVSLWLVPDAPTAELMSEFYRILQDNPDKAAALRFAMLQTLQKHPHPRDWAAFTLIGEAL